MEKVASETPYYEQLKAMARKIFERGPLCSRIGRHGALWSEVPEAEGLAYVVSEVIVPILERPADFWAVRKVRTGKMEHTLYKTESAAKDMAETRPGAFEVVPLNIRTWR